MTKVWQVAEEAQLLAEEKWIIRALNLVKKERNCLQIERLQLESLKMHKLQGKIKNKEPNTNNMELTTSVIELMKSYKDGNTTDSIVFTDETMSSTCNEEELNLTTSNSVFGHVNKMDFMEMEEDEEDTDIIIDMNMLMDSECDKNSDSYILG